MTSTPTPLIEWTPTIELSSTQIIDSEPISLPTPTPQQEPIGELSLSADQVRIYPVPQLVVGDKVTFQLLPTLPEGVSADQVNVQISVNDQIIVDGQLGYGWNLSGEASGLYQWVWDTTNAKGEHRITILLDPHDTLTHGDANIEDNRVDLTITVASAQILPAYLTQSKWQKYSTAYANIYVVEGTAAHRDHAKLITRVDAAIQKAATVLGIIPHEKIEVYFIDRVIGQGGYASGSMVITYSDRNYAGGHLDSVLVHESIHVLDNQLVKGMEYRFLTEGMAVWGSGGHYKTENLDSRAAGLLLDTALYIPLEKLVSDFYPAQHEIGYLEGGAFTSYLMRAYGLEKVRDFYSNLKEYPQLSLVDGMSQNMVEYFGKTLVELEADWHAFLREQPRTANDALDLTLTIEYYDLMRRYQMNYDKTAYFLYAWLPPPEYMFENQISGALTRRPTDEVNLVFEMMLVSADFALRNGDYELVKALFDSIERSLANDGRFIDPLSTTFLNLVRTTTSLGYEAQYMTLSADSRWQKVTVYGRTRFDNQLVPLTLSMRNERWTLAQ